MEEAVGVAEWAISTGASCQHGCLSPAVFGRLRADSHLLEALWSLDLITADGQGVVWGARLLGHRVPERVSGIDLMEALLVLAAESGYRLFFLGAEEDILLRALDVVKHRYPGVIIAGSHHGYFASTEEDEIVVKVNSVSPDILFLALPTPSKELFLARHRAHLKVPFAMSVGGSVDVLSGRRWRAPRWMRRIGLEWLARLVQEPRRLGPVYAVGHTRFIALVVAAYFRRRL
jgi:N-acetylglucosaminyldiphosphoundecaprenol N-acetyl-beta-D-mannosaminyltransferase